MKMIKASIIFLLIISLSSCATIVHGTHQTVSIDSQPSNASIWVDHNYIGNTPIVMELSRRNNHILHIELPNYQPYELILTRHISGWALGNIVFGGVIGLAVDAISGGLYRLTPEQLQIQMRSSNEYYKNENGSYIFMTLEPNPEWEKVGNLVACTQ